MSAILSNEANRTGINDRLEFAITYSDLESAGVDPANIGNANYGFRYYLVEDSDPTTAYGWKLEVKYGLLSELDSLIAIVSEMITIMHMIALFLIGLLLHQLI